MKRISHSWPTAGLAFFALFLITGCQRLAIEPYESFLPAPSSPPSTGLDNRSDGYVEAARLAERDSMDFAHRVNFTPGMKLKVVRHLGPAFTELKASAGKPCTLDFVPREPGQHSVSLPGWLMLSRALPWAVANHLDDKKYDQAVDIALAGLKFGLDLTGGDASEADLGFQTCEEITKVLAPILGEIPAPTLSRLSQGLSRRIKDRPRLAVALKNEGLNMLASVQFVQTCYQTKQYATLRAITLRDGRGAIDYLQNLRESERPRYFRGMADEAKSLVALLVTSAALPTADREKLTSPDGRYRPWKRLSKHFFGACGPLLGMNDRVVTRLNLLAVTAAIQAEVKETGIAPDQIPGHLGSVAMDPYTGKPLIYRASGTDYKIYSVGPNCRDDGGETNRMGMEPDLVLAPQP